MNADEALDGLARAHGISPEYKDMQGVVHHVTPDTQRAILRADGAQVDGGSVIREQLDAHITAEKNAYVSRDVVIRSEQAATIVVAGQVEWQVLSEDTGKLLAEGRTDGTISLPPLLDGVHQLRLIGHRGVQDVCLIAAPARAPSVQEVTGQSRVWGLMAALYGLRSEPPKRLADFDDLMRLTATANAQGAAFCGINPVHALGVATEKTSPYSPSHRGFLNIDHIGVSEPEILGHAHQTVDYAAHREAHRAALSTEFSRTRGTAEELAFSAFCEGGGDPLLSFARFEALSTRHGPDSRKWPATPTNVDAIRPEEIAFHMWLQWRAEQQLDAVQQSARHKGMAMGLYLDLAVGARLGGAESWGPQSAAAKGVSLGAPPDHLSPAGQNWQLAALSPQKLRAGNYAQFRFILRQNMRFCGLLRIDHALGLKRSFWLPEDGSPGGYIRHCFQSLVAIIAIEAKRAGTVIVGEDLGLVPQGFRDEMAAAGLYGYSVLQYEKDRRDNFLPAGKLRAQSLACFGTHDTPTFEGFWQGRDIAWWQKLGWIDAQEASRAKTKRTDEKRQLAHLASPTPLPKKAGPGLRDQIHAQLAQSPAALVAVQLDDILCLEEAQNLPGTVAEHPNWCRVYPQTLTEIDAGADLNKTGAIMADAGRATKKRKDTT